MKKVYRIAPFTILSWNNQKKLFSLIFTTAKTKIDQNSVKIGTIVSMQIILINTLFQEVMQITGFEFLNQTIIIIFLVYCNFAKSGFIRVNQN
jgi:hypothetical protein